MGSLAHFVWHFVQRLYNTYHLSSPTMYSGCQHVTHLNNGHVERHQWHNPLQKQCYYSDGCEDDPCTHPTTTNKDNPHWQCGTSQWRWWWHLPVACRMPLHSHRGVATMIPAYSYLYSASINNNNDDDTHLQPTEAHWQPCPCAQTTTTWDTS